MTDLDLDALANAAFLANCETEYEVSAKDFEHLPNGISEFIRLASPVVVEALIARARRAEELERAIDAIEAVEPEYNMSGKRLEAGWDEMKSIAAAVRARRRLASG